MTAYHTGFTLKIENHRVMFNYRPTPLIIIQANCNIETLK